MRRNSNKGFWAAPVLAAVIALGAIGGASASPTADSAAKKKQRGCQPAKNIEAIIDDSGSMSSSDPSKFRTQLLDAFAGINAGKRFGGVEFGSTANILWAAAPIPGVVPAMQASFPLVDSDNGGTDYDAGFSAANSLNPNADARIFLSDGLASTPTTHLTPKIKTYVVGLGADFVADPAAQALLAKVASDTGGPPPFLIADASQVPQVAGAITAGVDCAAKPIVFSDTFTAVGQVFTHEFRAQGPNANILTTWPTTGVTITPTLNGGRTATVAKVRSIGSAGATFSAIKLKGLRKGKKVRFNVTATALPQPNTATTQVIRSKVKKKKRK